MKVLEAGKLCNVMMVIVLACTQLYCNFAALQTIFFSNLKRIALFVQKLLGGPKISKIDHVTQVTPT